ncbi:MAG: DUF3786 domain-containing protein [Candidatus Hodarchaeales archaeon]
MHFLGLSVSLDDGTIYDKLQRDLYSGFKTGIYCLLSGYANSQESVETGELISYGQLRGGRTFHRTFRATVVNPLARIFQSNYSLLGIAAMVLEGEELAYGDFSVRLYSLPLVPITIILTSKSSELPASTSFLFDSSANNYLSTEELVILGDLTLERLRDASRILQNRKTEQEAEFRP